jgi:hypothetical protein
MCIKLVIKTNLYYDARPEKHQITCFNVETFVRILHNDKLTKATFGLVVKVNVIYFKVQQITLNLNFFRIMI